MLSEQYSDYVNSIIKLTKSINVKSEQHISKVNKYLMTLGIDTPLNMNDWKYYKNISGAYYTSPSVIGSDEIMYLTSLDTNELIVISKETLMTHTQTKNELSKYDTLYDTLVSTYPHQIDLIKGILNPVDVNTGIDSIDYTILGYSSLYIDSNEINLMKNVQKWIYNVTHRWDNSNYYFTDELYPAAILGILYINIPMIIINLRLKTCKTEEVNSYHLWWYLANYFRLDKYKNKIPYKQALFLYRNISYITNNSGKSSTLDFLNTNFANAFGLKLSPVALYLNYKSISENENIDWNLIKRKTLSFLHEYSAEENVYETNSLLSSEDVVRKTLPLGKLNGINYLQDVNTLENIGLVNSNTSFNTGLIECTTVDNVTDYVVNKMQLRLRYWMYLVSIKKLNYLSYVTINSLNVVLALNTYDCSLLMLYITQKIVFNKAEYIDKVKIKGIIGKLSDVKDSDQSMVLDSIIQNDIMYGRSKLHYNRFTDLKDILINDVNVYDLVTFDEYLTHIVNQYYRLYLLPTLESTSSGRSQIETLINRYVNTHTFEYNVDDTMDEFYSRIKFNINEYTDNQLLFILDELFKVCINVDETTDKLQPPYNYMVEILQTLSSYLVQFISGKSSDNIIPLDFNTCMLENCTYGANVGTVIAKLDDSSENKISYGAITNHSTSIDDSDGVVTYGADTTVKSDNDLITTATVSTGYIVLSYMDIPTLTKIEVTFN